MESHLLFVNVKKNAIRHIDIRLSEQKKRFRSENRPTYFPKPWTLKLMSINQYVKYVTWRFSYWHK